MRRAVILLLLWGGMQLLLMLDRADHPASSRTLLVFGFLILAAYTVGEIVTLIKLPKVTGYLFAGIIFGPSALGAVSSHSIAELAPVSRLAVALIAFLAGAELRWSELRERARSLLTMLGFELALSFIAIVGLLVGARAYVPFLSDTTVTEALVISALFASVAIVHSPAVVMALLTETRARGPVARTTLGMVLMADIVVVLLFSGLLAVARTAIPTAAASAGPSAGAVAWEIGGSILVGAALGGAIALYMRFVKRELLLFAIVVAFLGSEIARLAHVETLLTLLVAGFVVENGTKEGAVELLHAMERSAAPVFVVFFAVAGAAIVVRDVLLIWPVAVAIVVVRALAIQFGCKLGARLSPASKLEGRYVWMGLVAQAGVALGLVTVVSEAYPERGGQMATLFLAVIAINQLVGPVLSRIALARSGEIESGEGAIPRPADGVVAQS
ncbi:MAG: cation:proton antiporter [Gemmatimonadaceae bacterium]